MSYRKTSRAKLWMEIVGAIIAIIVALFISVEVDDDDDYEDDDRQTSQYEEDDD